VNDPTVSRIEVELDFLIEDFGLDTENMQPYTKFRLELCSTSSNGASGDDCTFVDFEVNHFDICWSQTISPAFFADTTLDQYVGDSYAVPFNAASSTSTSGMNCGQIQYSLWFSSDTTESTVNPNWFSIIFVDGVYKVKVSGDAPEGEYSLEVLATETGRSAYDQREVFSNALTVKVLDGCRVS